MKGICTNWDCPNFSEQKKNVIDIPDGEEFICPKCGKRLVEYTPGESWIGRNRLWVIIAALAVIVGTVLLLTIKPKTGTEPRSLPKNPQPDQQTPPVVQESTQDSLITESLPGDDTVLINIKPDPDTVYQIEDVEPVVITNVIEYPFGKYVGDIKFNDKLQKDIPEGSGTMYYYRHMQIAKHDKKNPPHYAEEGDYFIGTWGNGDIVNGALYSKDNVLKGKIFAPKRPNPYDLSKE